MQLKKKEVEEVHRKLMKDEPSKDHLKAFQMDFARSTRSSRVSSSYASPAYNPPVKIPVCIYIIFIIHNYSDNANGFHIFNTI